MILHICKYLLKKNEIYIYATKMANGYFKKLKESINKNKN